MRGCNMLSCLTHAFHYHKQCELNMCIVFVAAGLRCGIIIVLAFFSSFGCCCYWSLPLTTLKRFFLLVFKCNMYGCLWRHHHMAVCVFRSYNSSRIHWCDPMCFSAKRTILAPLKNCNHKKKTASSNKFGNTYDP